jgi:hypothetical protein
VRFARSPAGSPNAGTSLLTLDNAGNLTILAYYKATRMAVLTTATATDYYSNDGGAAPGWDSAKYGMLYRQGYDQGIHLWYTTAAPAGAYVEKMRVAQNGDIMIAGANATKASGTTWINPSDSRLKDDIAPYAAGLAEVCHLVPITYRLKAHPDGPLCYGFDASAVREVLPECVATARMKLTPDDEEETDVLTFDMHPILVAMVTAIKELAARVAALEARA